MKKIELYNKTHEELKESLGWSDEIIISEEEFLEKYVYSLFRKYSEFKPDDIDDYDYIGWEADIGEDVMDIFSTEDILMFYLSDGVYYNVNKINTNTLEKNFVYYLSLSPNLHCSKKEKLKEISKNLSKIMDKAPLECNQCGITGYWDKVSENGNFYYCELCHRDYCFDCLSKTGIINNSNIICKECLDEYTN